MRVERGVERLASLSHDLAGTGGDQSYGFSYNTASQIVSRTGSNDAYASNSAYDVNRSYAVNGLNQYTAAGPATFAYDANGNLRSDGSNSYVYDAENRLVSATAPPARSASPTTRSAVSGRCRAPTAPPASSTTATT